MRSILRATRLRARAGALAVIALLAVAAGPLADTGRPAPAAGTVVAGDIGWPSPAPAGPVLASARAAQDDIGWPAPPKA
ncbi:MULTISPECIES: hypothetical protein [Streptomyces]|uniref:Uncharacterized protein n=1 Tax=Streptomyces hydrogenans TaxID=1873719 RepID=A0ABQ3PER2_9ACTN|nr:MULTISPECIES: hypothetical protein [Streptomyces]MCM1945272.1 hypothetical protein [Streptomyces sp. G2]GHI23492.1 hypothetical protein Shyd_48630 [Streptomyces hydrogenans]GHJ92723.1 hypothetical protein SNE510_22420 [Streptomyces sp. NE5-10]